MIKLKEFGSKEELAKNRKFVHKIYSMAQPNPMNDRQVFFSFKDKDVAALIIVEMTPLTWAVVLDTLTVAEGKTGLGFGDHVLKIITKEADKDGIKITLSAVPLDHAGKKIPKGKLKAFYKKHGFKSSGGDNMIREPKG